jgi:ATP-binding cassette subfamily B protein
VSLLRRHLRPYRRDILLGFLCLLITNALTLTIPWLLKRVTDALRQGTTTRTVAGLAGAIAATALLLAVVRAASRLSILGVSRRVVYDIRNELFAHLQSLPASFYAARRTGEIMSRAVNDLQLIRSLCGPAILNVLNIVILYSVGLTMMALIDPLLTLLAVLPYPLLLFGVFRVSRVIHERSNATQDQLAAISNKAQENLSGVAVVKAFVREDEEIASFGGLSREYRRLSLRLARTRGLIVTLMGGLGGLSTIIVLWLGSRHIVDGRLTLGGLVAEMSYLALLTGPTIMMGWVLGVFQRGLGALQRVEAILAERSDLPGDRVTGDGPPPAGAVSLRGLTFAYPGADRPALRDIRLEVPAGSVVGIVGRVGAGKSTLMRLLAGIHPVAPGMITLDGRDLTTIPTAQLRARLGYVPQETFLFSRSVADNIALGRPDAGRDDIERVAALAQITGDLPDLPQGLDSLVGERGVTLSGGQRQRVALARALLMDPAVLILDDALSSVDAETEEAILGGLRGFLRGRTAFVIAHRVSTVLDADVVVALNDGRIAESGRPADLLAAGGEFAAMVRRQQIERELEAL